MNMIETIKIMLDALENHTAIKHPQQIHYRDRAIEAGKTAIAEAEKHEVSQEPVAWMDEYGRLLKYVDPICPTDTPLYTHPQPKREQSAIKVAKNKIMCAAYDFRDAHILGDISLKRSTHDVLERSVIEILSHLQPKRE